MFQIRVLGVPQHDIFRVPVSGCSGRVSGGAVVLFVWFKTVPVFIQVEGLMKQPGAVFHIGGAERIQWLIPAAGELPPV